jgi:hypothetical protein
MNLHAIVSGAIGAVNPPMAGSLKRSAGYTTDANYSQVPIYEYAENLMFQVQALTWKDLQQLSGINIEGEQRAMYVNGQMQGVSRPGAQGGDLVTLCNGTVWLVTKVLEDWSYTDCWCKVAVTRQMK